LGSFGESKIQPWLRSIRFDIICRERQPCASGHGWQYWL